MPSTAPRKSSLGTRRGLQKAHIPYRGDNPEVGKKTGIAVQHVERKSDGFEPFEEIMQQADKRTPPKPKGRKRKKSIADPVALDDSFDEDGEMSMDIDSPVRYFNNVPPPITPTSYRTSMSSARAVSRTSHVDFDAIPSPRIGSGRKSMGHHAHSKVPGSSRLSEFYTANDIDQEDAMDAHDGSPARVSPQRTSFARMAHNDDDDDDDDDDINMGNGNPLPDPEEEPSPSVSARNKGKARARMSVVPEEPNSEVEDEIAQGLEDVEEHHSDHDDGGYDQQYDRPEPSPRQKKKTKITIEEPKKPGVQSHSKSKKENRPVREGVRKSSRTHYKPLEWWRGEKLVYGRRDDEEDRTGQIYVAPIKEIMRIPRDQPVPLGKRKRGQTRYRSRSKAVEEQVQVVPVTNPEEGWDDNTDPHCAVFDYASRELVERRIAWTATMVDPKKVSSEDWSFQKVFGDADFMAAGVLVIPPQGRKSSKPSKDNTYVFYIAEGAIHLKIHESSLVLATGAMFIVPRGNTYMIENICERDVKLFFTQARKVAAEEVDAIFRPTSVRPGRSSSAGALENGKGGRDMSKAPAPKRAASTRT